MALLDPSQLTSEWRRFERGEELLNNIAITLEDARAVAAQSDDHPHAAEDGMFDIFAEPRVSGNPFETPAAFAATFPWFPPNFPWEMQSGTSICHERRGCFTHASWAWLQRP